MPRSSGSRFSTGPTNVSSWWSISSSLCLAAVSNTRTSSTRSDAPSNGRLQLVQLSLQVVAGDFGLRQPLLELVETAFVERFFGGFDGCVIQLGFDQLQRTRRVVGLFLISFPLAVHSSAMCNSSKACL